MSRGYKSSSPSRSPTRGDVAGLWTRQSHRTGSGRVVPSGRVTHVREEREMPDISFERKRSLSRQEAAVWLKALAKGFADGDEVKLPVGGGGVVTLRIPEHVEAEFEVDVSGDEVEVELEFTWSLTGTE